VQASPGTCLDNRPKLQPSGSGRRIEVESEAEGSNAGPASTEGRSKREFGDYELSEELARAAHDGVSGRQVPPPFCYLEFLGKFSTKFE